MGMKEETTQDNWILQGILEIFEHTTNKYGVLDWNIAANEILVFLSDIDEIHAGNMAHLKCQCGRVAQNLLCNICWVIDKDKNESARKDEYPYEYTEEDLENLSNNEVEE